jgi:tetratricopeptide (TPR) repeat protein
MNQEKFAAAVDAEESGHPRLAKRLYEECLAHEPLFGSAWLRYLGLLHEQGEYTKVIAAKEKVLVCTLSDWERSIAYNILGQCYLEREDFPDAEEHFRHSQTLRPDPNTCSLLYMVLLRQQREEEGVAFLREALVLDETYEEAHYNLGCYYKRKRQDEAAEQCFRRAIGLDPEFGHALAELGFLVAKKGKEHLLEASQLLARAVALVPEYGWGHISYANVLWRLKKLPEAETQYQRGIELCPKESIAHRSYGRFLSETYRDEAKAEAFLQSAIVLAPEDAIAHKMLGVHLLRYGKLAYARKELEAALILGDEGALNYLKLVKKHE